MKVVTQLPVSTADIQKHAYNNVALLPSRAMV